MSTLIKKAVFTTELNADCTEWCPILDYADIFVCGTYQLSKVGQGENSVIEEKRIGHLYLFKFTKVSPEYIKLLQKLSMPGILDCKWCHLRLENKIYLALVNAVGELKIIELREKDREVYLEEVQTIKVTPDEDTLLLSLDWSTVITSTDVRIVVSSSVGDVAIVSYQNGSFLKDKLWNLHGFEAWIVAFNYWNINSFFSGGDDCKLQCFDIGSGQVTKTNRSHSAGVTSLHMNSKQEHILISGSYDEQVFFWDIRNMNKPRNKINVGGGVWRLKWEPKMCNKICASCMYFGSVIIDAESNAVIAEYKEHGSINYGIDWSYLQEERICRNFNIDESEDCISQLISVCSFYDNLLTLALLRIPK